MTVDKFKISSHFRFQLVFEPLFPLFIIGITVWAISTPPYLRLSKWGPLILVGLAGWAVWEFIRLFRWFGFYVELSDEGVNISGAELRWVDLASAHAKTAFKFDTFIELNSKDGRTFKIPACIQQNSFVLAKIEKHFPEITKET